MYGTILSRWAGTDQDPTGIFLRFLASVIYHFEWIQQMDSFSKDHPFNAIPLLFKADLVDELKSLVTTEPSPVIWEASGIPPHVEHSCILQRLLDMAHETLLVLKQKVVDVKQVSYILNHFFILCIY